MKRGWLLFLCAGTALNAGAADATALYEQLVATKSPAHALKLAHRGYVLVNGQITLSGSGAELMANEHIRAAYLEGGH